MIVQVNRYHSGYAQGNEKKTFTAKICCGIATCDHNI